MEVDDVFKLDLGYKGETKPFVSAEDLKEFLTFQYKSWVWVRGDGSGIDKEAFVDIYDVVIDFPLSYLMEFVEKWESVESLSDDHVQGYLSEIEEFLNFVQIPMAGSSLGDYILSIRKRDPVLARLMLYTFSAPKGTYHYGFLYQYAEKYTNIGRNGYEGKVSRHWEDLQIRIHEANRELALFEVFSGEGSGSYLDRLEKVYNRIEEFEHRAAARYVLFVETNKQLESQYESLVASSIESYNKTGKRILHKILRRGVKNKRYSERALKEALDNINDAQNAFRSQINFDETSKYWKEKKALHVTSKRGWLAALGISLAITILSPYFGYSFSKEIDIPQDKLLFGVFHPLQVVTTLVILSVGSFAIRFCSRQYSSHQHLALEAEERRTMLKTYIGMMMNGKLHESEDRKVALDTLFRPAQTGIVEDNANLFPSDSIVKIIDKGGAKS